MASGHSRVTVVSPDRRVDLSLPGSVPLGDLMPQLLDLCTDHHDRTAAMGWTLRPVGGAGLTWASSLDSARIRDGTVLELSPNPTKAVTRVDDVRDATEDAVDRGVRNWTPRDTSTLAVLTLTTIAAALVALPDVWTDVPGNGIPLAALIAGLAFWGSVSVARRHLYLAAHVLYATGLGWLGALVLSATLTSGLSTAARAATIGAAVGCISLALAWLVPHFIAWAAAAVVGCSAVFSWAAMDLAGLSGQDAIAVGSAVGILAVGAMPRASVAAGGLAALDCVVRTRGSVDPETVLVTFARSRGLLTGAVLAIAALTALGAVQLGLDGSPMSVAQSVAVAVCLVLRARAFSQFGPVLILVVAGTGSLLTLLVVHLADASPRLPTIVLGAVVVAVAAGLAGSGLSTANEVAGARGRRLLDAADSVAVATLIPLLAGNLGVLHWVRGLVN